MNCNTTHYRANSSSVPGDPTILSDGVEGSLDECCDALVRSALSNGGVDNTTVIVLRVNAPAEQHHVSTEIEAAE